MASPWYRDGLRFQCTQCGDCCTGSPGHVWVNREEADRLASFLGLSPDEFARQYLRLVGTRHSLIEKPNGDCIFYRKGCTVYPARPGQCQTFPFWPENLVTRADWKEVGEECPGVGEGKLYPLEEVRSIRDGKSAASEDHREEP